MPSSPDSTAWPLHELHELRELRGAGVPVPPVARFSAAEGTAAEPQLFEVSSSAGVPDSVLAPARAAAQAAGYAAGWASGIQAARVVADAEAHAARAETQRSAIARRAQLQQAFTALDQAAATFERRAVPTAEQVEALIVSSALAIAEQLVGHSLRNDPDRAPAALARALQLAPAGEAVTVRISPVDHAVLTADGTERAEAAVPDAAGRAVTLVADETLQPGDAVATSGATVIDARVAAGLERVRAVLSR